MADARAARREGSGRRLGAYRLVELLGQGGMGDVWSAVHEGAHGTTRKAVIKTIRESLVSNERAVEMFLREARLASGLRHPHIVVVHELGYEDGTYFLAMEHLEGLAWHDIAQRCWRWGRTLPLEVVVRAASQAAIALDHAHALRVDGKPTGLVHRDVSPDNLFLCTSGATKLLDFGIAKSTDVDATNLTEKGELRGKLPYMAPEQVRGERVDGRADLWSLGVSLFYFATAQRPFDRPSPPATMNAILLEAAPRASDWNPLVPEGLSDVIARCFAKEPTQRWPSGRALGEALRGLLPAGLDDVAQARALIDEAGALEKGDRRPMTAPAARTTVTWPVPAEATAMNAVRPSLSASTADIEGGPTDHHEVIRGLDSSEGEGPTQDEDLATVVDPRPPAGVLEALRAAKLAKTTQAVVAARRPTARLDKPRVAVFSSAEISDDFDQQPTVSQPRGARPSTSSRLRPPPPRRNEKLLRLLVALAAALAGSLLVLVGWSLWRFLYAP